MAIRPVYPMGSDVCMFVTDTKNSSVTLKCLICHEIIGPVNYLNEAVRLWTEHLQKSADASTARILERSEQAGRKGDTGQDQQNE